MAQTVRLGLALMAAAQAQKHVTHNDALLSIDALVQAVVAETDRLAPPAAPQEGDAYLIGTAPTGAFAGQAGMLAALSREAGGSSSRRRAGWCLSKAAMR